MGSGPKTSEKLSGTRPQGARNEREAAAQVRDMFSRIAPRYDFLNHFLSFSLDHAWRHRTARQFQQILRRTDARILDLCCGTGDLAFALDRARVKAIRDAGAHRVPIVGGDFAQPMLGRARKKAEASVSSVVFLAADAMRLPFPDSSFDLVTTAFGFRNLVNYEAGLREIARVLRPGGKVGILEFSEPRGGPMAGLFRFYFRRILPRIGGAVSGSNEAYAYLPGSVARFPSPSQLSRMLQRSGFEEVHYRSWNFGSVTLHSGKLGENETGG